MSYNADMIGKGEVIKSTVKFSRWAYARVTSLLIFPLLWQYYVLRCTYLVITDRRIFFSKGVFNRQEESFPIRRVDSIRVTRNFIQRILGYGTVIVVAGNKKWKFRYVKNYAEISRVFSEVEDTKY